MQKPAQTDHPVLDVIRERWSPRAFDPDRTLSEADLAPLFEAWGLTDEVTLATRRKLSSLLFS